MGLSTLWFALIAVLLTGYLILEGFDFGVGMLTSILPRGDYVHKEKERRVLINTIGPVWDGNEVWILAAGGAIFAAFPEWYATMFSGFYLPLLLILLALIVRAVSFEYRGRIESPGWRRAFDLCLSIGSWVPAFLWGVALANLVRGLNLDGNHQYIGGFWALLNPFAILGGLATVLLCLLHGATFVSLKTKGGVRRRAHKLARQLALAALVVAGAWAIWAQIAYGKLWTWIPVLVAALALIAIFLLLHRSIGSSGIDGTRVSSVPNASANSLRSADGIVYEEVLERDDGLAIESRHNEKLAFALSALIMAAVVALIFGSMYPYAIPGLRGGPGLLASAASSTPYTLRIMTIVALTLTPIVIAYQIWAYRVFRRRISTRDIPPSDGLSWKVLKGKAFGTPEEGYVTTYEVVE